MYKTLIIAVRDSGYPLLRSMREYIFQYTYNFCGSVGIYNRESCMSLIVDVSDKDPDEVWQLGMRLIDDYGLKHVLLVDNEGDGYHLNSTASDEPLEYVGTVHVQDGIPAGKNWHRVYGAVVPEWDGKYLIFEKD